MIAVASVFSGAGQRASASAPSPSVQGGGSGFAALVMDQWRADVARSFGVDVGYTAQGSAFGQQQFIDGAFDFAATDVPFSPDQLATLATGRCAGIELSSCFDVVPVTAGGVGFMFDLTDADGHRVTTLNITRRVACEIFTGAIARWNDPDIVAANPDLASFDRPIRPVVHAEGSGSSFALSQYCIAVAPTVWTAFVAAQKSGGFDVDDSAEFNAGQPTRVWPTEGWNSLTVPVAYDDAVASYVADPVAGADSITILPASYALIRDFPVASVQNASGHFVAPDVVNVTVGLSYGTAAADGSFTPGFDGADPRAYQPDQLSWIAAPNAGFDPAKGSALGRFLCWAVTGGQDVAPRLLYAPLSTGLRAMAVDAIERIPGAPDAATCAAGPPAAPGNVRASVHGHTVDVSWSAANGHGIAITSYHVVTSSGSSTRVSGARTDVSLTLPPSTYTFNVYASSAAGDGDWSAPSNMVRVIDIPPRRPRRGYWMLGSDGKVYAFGQAPLLGSARGRFVAIAPRRDGRGYWITDAAGNVSHFGAAAVHGGRPALRSDERVSTISATPSGDGYWLFTDRGRAFGYGDARWHGDMSGAMLNGPIVASVATPTGNGYYMVGADGGVFSFGDARFHGSTGNRHLNRPVVGISPTPGNRGYWLVAADGGVFAFNAPFRGSMGAVHLNRAVNGIVAYGTGYLMVASDGGVFDFSGASFLGSLADSPPPAPVIGIAAFIAS